MSSAPDIIKVAYRVLFSLQLELAGGELVGSDVMILPDPSNLDLFRKYRILNKTQKAGTIMLIETVFDGVDKGEPEVPLQANEMFRFQIKLDRSFLPETHLESYDFTENVLYASNAANNVVSANVLLSLPLPSYNPADTYEKGYLVQAGTRYYRAIQKSDNGNQHAVTETAFWKEIDNGFVSQADLRTRASLTQPADLDTMIVVEIVHDATLPADYKLLDASLKCLEVIYNIRLLR